MDQDCTSPPRAAADASPYPISESDGPVTREEFARQSISKLQNLGVFEGNMPFELINAIYNEGWQTGERWAERQRAGGQLSSNRDAYREGYRDGFKDGIDQAAKATSQRAHGALDITAIASVNSCGSSNQPSLRDAKDPHISSGALRETPEKKPALDTSPKSIITDSPRSRQTSPLAKFVSTQSGGGSTNAVRTETPPHPLDPAGQSQVHSNPQGLPRSEKKMESGHCNRVTKKQAPTSPDLEYQEVKVEDRQSTSPACDVKEAVFGNPASAKPLPSLKRRLKSPPTSNRSGRTFPSTPPAKRADSLVDTVEKSEERPFKRPRENPKPDDGKRNDSKVQAEKRKKITTSSQGKFVFSTDDRLDDQDLILTTCPDALANRVCSFGPAPGINCQHFHLCPKYGLRDWCKYPTHHGNLLHLQPTCISIVLGRACNRPRECTFGHEEPDARLKKDRDRKECNPEREFRKGDAGRSVPAERNKIESTPSRRPSFGSWSR